MEAVLKSGRRCQVIAVGRVPIIERPNERLRRKSPIEANCRGRRNNNKDKYLSRKTVAETIPEEVAPAPKLAKPTPAPKKVEKAAPAPAITQATIIKRLRQKISMPKAPVMNQKIKQKTVEPFFKSTFTQKLVDKLREKNHAA